MGIGQEKALVVVAHWDDEIISAWGAMLYFKADVLCLTDKKSYKYADIFCRVVKYCGGRADNWKIPLRKENGKLTNLVTSENIGRLSDLVDHKKYKLVFAHHFNGDIGCHPHHRMAANLCYSAAYGQRRDNQVSLYSFGSGRWRWLPDSLWLGFGKCLKIEISEQENQRRLEFAHEYKVDFEKHYPIICQKQETHYKIPARKPFQQDWMNLKYGGLLAGRKCASRIVRAMRLRTTI
jgi:LmbE family N-acetylglucosaminyl deacetylase